MASRSGKVVITFNSGKTRSKGKWSVYINGWQALRGKGTNALTAALRELADDKTAVARFGAGPIGEIQAVLDTYDKMGALLNNEYEA